MSKASHGRICVMQDDLSLMVPCLYGRKKMRACGILSTGCLSPKASDQCWQGEEDSAFLGGFGSDYCSGDTEDSSRIYKDRGQQIAIAYRRALTCLSDKQKIVRVVHIGEGLSLT